MGRIVGIGIQDFEKIKERNCFYVDKTSFIKEWWENGDECTLITRPRRFGKTLNLSLVEKFFSIDYAKREDLFEDLFIWKEENYRKLQGTYPVISLSFADVKGETSKIAKRQICDLIADQYNKYSFLLKEDLLSESEKDYFRSVDYQMDDAVAIRAIQRLSKFLEQYYKKKVIILLDEYDTPMQEAWVNGYWKDLIYFIRSFFNATFKTNPFLERSLMTGITRVSRESLFSDLNHLKIITATSKNYASSFGFTEKEVFDALEEFGIGEEKDKVKFWYDGFVFGEETDIYNPWSIINFIREKRYDTYWVNTAGNSLVSKLMQEGSREVKLTLERLIHGESIQCTIDEQIVYDQLEENESSIWSLLAATGYLKILSHEKEDEVKDEELTYEVMLTNYEVKRMFQTMIRGWFQGVRSDYNCFITALLQMDLEAMNEYMSRIALQIFSYFDTGSGIEGKEAEKFYHGFVLGLIIDLTKDYIITSNRESGFGRYDVILEPREKGKPAFILEFKSHNSQKEKNLEETVQAALEQIRNKEYDAGLIQRGIPKNKICKYGFAFEGKKVLIGEK